MEITISSVGCRHVFSALGLPDVVPVRLHGADDVELPAERHRFTCRQRARNSDGNRRGRADKEDSSRTWSGFTTSSTKTAVGAGGRPTTGSLFMTAYVVSGLAKAKAAGYNIKHDAITRTSRRG